MRSLAIREAQEAMESGVAVRDNDPTDFLAGGVRGGKPHLEHD
jgi:hypothetical protein